MENKMNILVTGAAGFIGKHFVYNASKYLNNTQIVCVDKLTYAADPKAIQFFESKQIPFYCDDINDTISLINYVNYYKIDIIVNFAAETHVDNSIKSVTPFIDSNIYGVESVLEVVRKTNTKLLHISTDEVYGPATEKPFLEEDKLQPKNPYAATKAAAEMLINSYVNTHDVKAWIVRPTNNFGEHQNIEKFIPKYIECYKNSTPFPLYGNGEQIREWLYVKDTAKIVYEICCKIVDGEKIPDILNIGTPDSSLSNIEMCKKLYKLLNGSQKDFEKSIVFVTDRPGHDIKYAIDINKMQMLFKNHSFDRLEDSLKNVINSI